MATEDTRLSTQVIAQTIGFYIIPVPYLTIMSYNSDFHRERDYTIIKISLL